MQSQGLWELLSVVVAIQQPLKVGERQDLTLDSLQMEKLALVQLD
jgi:hypothetical protein